MFYKIKRLLFVLILIFSWLVSLVFIFFFKENNINITNAEKIIYNKDNSNKNINSKKLNPAIKVGWLKQAFYYLDQHIFQRLFIQEWIRLFPNLPQNKLRFLYITDNCPLPIAVKVIYQNPFNNFILQQWKFVIN